MKRISIFWLSVLLLSISTKPTSAQSNLSTYVDPFIGTDGFGHTFPGATTPFGMVQLSPDTRTKGWENCSGYHSSNKTIIGFSHMHLSGTGAADYGDIMFMATIGLQTQAGDESKPLSGYRSAYTKETESAKPGYYKVKLDDHGIIAEMTATTRTGIQRYTFPSSDSAYIVLDLDHGIEDKTTETMIEVIDNKSISGYRRSRGWAKDQIVFFHAEFSEPFADMVFTDSKSNRLKGKTQSMGEGIKAAFRFTTSKGKQVMVRTGISTVSRENAKLNLTTELNNWDFEKVMQSAAASWDQELARISVKGGTSDQLKVFYTSLYHCMIHPNIMSDVDGRYRGMDNQIHTVEKGKMYTVFSLWDTFRALHPLFTIIDPDRAQDFVRSLLAKFKESGTLPVWELASNETGCMIGYHSVPVIVDAYMKGLKDFDTTLALNACMKSAMMDHLGLKYYKKTGYIPADKENESVSKTLEYAYDDWCIYQMAKAMGRTGESKIFERRSNYHLNVFDKSSGFVRGKKNGNWVSPFDPYEVSGIYTEANAWQYNWFMPHDINGMIGLAEGIDKFTANLETLFSAENKLTGRSQPDISGLIGQYAHGNEPSHHMAYLFNYTSQPFRTADIARKIMDDFYTTKRDGLIGNEDCGQMSAWYVFSAMGFYPVCPGSNLYDIGTPLFDEVMINPGNGKTTSIRSIRKNKSDRYVSMARINGKESGLQFEHRHLAEGAKIEFELAAESNAHLNGVGVSTKPSKPSTMIPFVESCEKAFFDSCMVVMKCHTDSSEIRYTLDGSEPNRNSILYSKPITISQSSKLRMIAYRNGYEKSSVEEVEFIRLPYRKTVTYKKDFSHNYTAGGKNGLVDGIQGEPNAFGSWQGFWGDNFEATIDLGDLRTFSKIETTFLQQYPSWIWLPSEVTYEVSSNGSDFKEIYRKKNGIPLDKDGAFVEAFKSTIPNMQARYVRIKAVNMGKCPEWHPGSGNPSWIFVDEVTIE
ncbi:MAG: GH92 family glycosyl hydrolase [Bacteroidota bacterium]